MRKVLDTDFVSVPFSVPTLNSNQVLKVGSVKAKVIADTNDVWDSIKLQ